MLKFRILRCNGYKIEWFRVMLFRFIKNIFMVFCISPLLKAEEKMTAGISRFAENSPTTETFLVNMTSKASFVLGTLCLFGAFLQYLEYRKNTYQASVGAIIILAIPGIIFVSLPYLTLFTGAGLTSLQK
jgi:hypothetical protein